MPEYFFHVRTPDQVARQPERRELPNLGEALAAANSAAHALIRRRVRRGQSGPRGIVEVEDEKRRPVARILLTELAQQIS
jgi:hypothetical protein